MRIQEIILTNIGPYLGKNTITFHTDDRAKNIVLVGGRNGAGKTTLFDAMKICLYGYKLYGYRQNSQTYTAKIKKMINDSVKRGLSPTAGLALSIHIEDGYSSNIFTISRDWIFHKSQIKETYCVHKNGALLSDEERGDFDNYLLQTIPPALFDFHFFNGETITDFLFDKENGHSFRRAFMQICGLDTLDLIQEQLQNNIRAQSKSNDSAFQDDYFAKKENYEQLEQQSLELAVDLKEAEHEIAQLEEASILLDHEMTRYGGMQSNEWQHVQEQMKVEETLREETHRYLKDNANNIIPFLILKKELAELQQQIQIETSIANNRTIRELLLAEETKAALSDRLTPYLKNPSEYLGDEFYQTLYDAIKADYPEHTSEFLKLSERERLNVLSKIDGYLAYDEEEIIVAEKRIKKSLARTKRLRTKIDTKEVLSSEQYLRDKNEVLIRIDSIRKNIIELTEKSVEIDNKLLQSKQAFDKASAKFKEILKERSVSDISAKAMLAFDELRKNLYSKYVSQVENAFARNFHLLLTKDSLLDGIYISEDFEVVPYRQTKIEMKSISALIAEGGEEYAREQLGERAFKLYKSNAVALDNIIELPIKIDQHFSAGEKQIYVMALYQALSEIRSSEIPFVIDTPLARIDSAHRKNILNNFFSKLPGQVIILSTDEEIDANSIKPLQNKLSDLYLIEYQEDGRTAILQNQYFKGVSI